MYSFSKNSVLTYSINAISDHKNMKNKPEVNYSLYKRSFYFKSIF